MWLIIKQNKLFFIPYLFFIVISLFFLCVYSKSEIHIFFNHYNHKAADILFQILTFSGNGSLTAFTVLIYLFIKYRYAILIAFSGIVSGIIVQILKLLIFPDMQRPKTFFEGVYDLYLVEGVKLHGYHSFPSGHTATAFALFLVLAVINKNHGLKFMFFIFAFFIGYSRIYLSQHFLNDVVAGSLTGVLFSLVTIMMVNSYNKPWIEKSLKSYKEKPGV